MKKLVKLCKLNEIEEGKIYSFEINPDNKIILIKFQGKIYALEGICTHAYAELQYGFLIEDRVVCPLHLSQFEIKTGKVVNPPAETDLKVYKVKIENNEIFIEI